MSAWTGKPDEMQYRGNRGGRMRRRIAGAVLMSVALVGLLAGTAAAKEINPYQYASSFDGSDTTAGPMTGEVFDIAINQGDGSLYVSDQTSDPCPGDMPFQQSISRFNSAGQAQPFAALEGASSLCVEERDSYGELARSLVFDNTGHG